MTTTRVSQPTKGRNVTGSRTEPKPQLSDEQWFLIADLFTDPPVSDAGGRPRVDARSCLEGILWVLRTGARWKEASWDAERLARMKDQCGSLTYLPSPSTCWRRFNEWTEAGIFLIAWKRLLEHLDGRKLIAWSEAFGDGTFSPAKKGAPKSARPSAAREPRSCCWSTETGSLSLWILPVRPRRK